jgi:DNA modification methylase
MIDTAKNGQALAGSQQQGLEEIERLDSALMAHFGARFVVRPSLSRTLVSFQANKGRPVHRWYKYKEAFSATLVEQLLAARAKPGDTLLDPFAGSGTALFVARELGLMAEGIELLPIGQEIIAAKLCAEDALGREDIEVLRRWLIIRPWSERQKRQPLSTLRITQGAYPADTQTAIEQYMAAWEGESRAAQRLLRFALLCVLEAVSYTRKDGQYLRWDNRSARRPGTRSFNKGRIAPFDEAISTKLVEIVADIENRERQGNQLPVSRGGGEIMLHAGSCLEILPTLAAERYNFVVTSPPYCNRYDYTRTYALELALLGVGERELVELRQIMLSSTVENRGKDLLQMNPEWERAVEVADREELLQAVLRYLEGEKAEGRLNNNGIPRMVRGYFYEMACAIAECSRVMRRGGQLFMVNDNVRYAGAKISVDMILSHMAEQLGLEVENILVLPGEKGNSSQQMGRHGREPLRKCVYAWRKV